jgi:hypothetical protein
MSIRGSYLGLLLREIVSVEKVGVLRNAERYWKPGTVDALHRRLSNPGASSMDRFDCNRGELRIKMRPSKTSPSVLSNKILGKQSLPIIPINALKLTRPGKSLMARHQNVTTRMMADYITACAPN